MSSPSRHVVQAEALAWLDANPADAGALAGANASVVTSLPDVSELPELDLDGWRRWFVDAVRRVVRWTPPGGLAIFYQSDVRHAGAWIDKGYLVMRGADDEGRGVVWHKIVCRKPPGSIALGRPSYSHMIAIGAPPPETPRNPGPDVLPEAGFMPWSRAMGVAACRVACAYLRDATATRTVVDPFCGRGTVLAVANAMGFDAVGVDVSAKRCRAARALIVGDEVDLRGAAAALGPRGAFAAGARLYDAGAFWEAHEVWEARWRVETDDAERRFLQGLIQVAAAFHQIFVQDAPDAALRLLAKGAAKIAGAGVSPPDVDVARFLAGVDACARAIEGGSFDAASVPKLGVTP